MDQLLVTAALPLKFSNVLETFVDSFLLHQHSFVLLEIGLLVAGYDLAMFLFDRQPCLLDLDDAGVALENSGFGREEFVMFVATLALPIGGIVQRRVCGRGSLTISSFHHFCSVVTRLALLDGQLVWC